VRAYTFTYTAGREGRQTFLESVTLSGSDDTVLLRADGQPAASTFLYHQKMAGLAGTAQMPARPVLAPYPTVLRWSDTADTLHTAYRDVLDMNGDGFPDLVDAKDCPAGGTGWNVYLGSEEGFSADPIAWYVRVPACRAPSAAPWTPRRSRVGRRSISPVACGLGDARATPWLVYPGTRARRPRSAARHAGG
jgi:hypothetical protein